MLFVVLDDFLNDEIQEFLGEFRVKIGLACKVGQPGDLRRFAGRIAGWKVMGGFQFTNRLGVGKAFAQRVDKDRIQSVNAGTVVFENLSGLGDRIGHVVTFGWR